MDPTGKAKRMRNEIFWMRDAALRPRPRLTGSRTARVAIVGGGIAGLTVARELLRRGAGGIVLLESRFCGAGASGRSSGFITPASELELTQLRRRFGDDDARLLWDASQAGCDSIRQTIDHYRLDCDLLDADSLYIASDASTFSTIEREHESRRVLGYDSRLYGREELPSILGSETYGGAVRYGSTFGINAFAFTRALSERLAAEGVQIFEESPVVALDGNVIHTPGGSVRADAIFFCVDHRASGINVARHDVYHAQTFLTISEPLGERHASTLFPGGPLLVWDTDLIYQYFRLTPDRRLLLGGGLLSRTYAPERPDDQSPVEHLMQYVQERFPQLEGVRFESRWPGLIGVSKDLLPLAGRCPGRTRQYVALCAAGLPWSVAAARTAVAVALDGESELERFFDPRRRFTELDLVQPAARKPLTFALSHAYAKSLLKGDGRQVAHRTRALGTILLTAAAAAAFALAWKRLRRRP
jgi:gamma-glutamylputrescine oxidase